MKDRSYGLLLASWPRYQKCFKTIVFSILLAPSAFQLRGKIYKKASPDRSKIKQKFGQHLDPIFNGFWRPTWFQDPPKTFPKSMKNRLQMDIQINHNFVCILNGLLVALGANMAPKACQKRVLEGLTFPPVLGLGGVLGGLGASWGPRADFNRFLFDCSSIF